MYTSVKLMLALAVAMCAMMSTEGRSASPETAQYRISMGEINREADRQLIDRPSFGQQMNIFSVVANGYLSVKQGGAVKALRTLRWKEHSDNVFIRSHSYHDSLVSFITRRGLVGKTKYWNALSYTERLVRQGDSLVAKSSDEGNAARFMFKRYPPVCGDVSVEKTKPQYLQLMLVENDGGVYHRSVLHVSYDYRNRMQLKLLKSSSNEADICKHVKDPSVVPGTLFMVDYK